jgi:hypothetical protein
LVLRGKREAKSSEARQRRRPRSPTTFFLRSEIPKRNRLTKFWIDGLNRYTGLALGRKSQATNKPQKRTDHRGAPTYPKSTADTSRPQTTITPHQKSAPPDHLSLIPHPHNPTPPYTTRTQKKREPQPIRTHESFQPSK